MGKNNTGLIFALRALVYYRLMFSSAVPSKGGSARGAILHNVTIRQLWNVGGNRVAVLIVPHYVT